MLKRSLSLAVVVEAEFIHCVAVDGPVVRDIPLLETLRHNVTEARKIASRVFEQRKWIQRAVVVEVVINAEILFIVQAMIHLHRNLVAANCLGRHCADEILSSGWSRYKLQKID